MSRAVVATVGKIDGTVTVIDGTGAQRLLRAGDALNAGERIVTSAGASVVLLLVDGTEFRLGENAELPLAAVIVPVAPAAQAAPDAEVAESGSATPSDNATVRDVLTAIAEGRDIDEELAETAAGLQGADGGIGNGFVRVVQVNTADGAPELDVSYEAADVPATPVFEDFTDTVREGNSLVGSDGGQFLVGDSAEQTLQGGPGNDTLWGGDGSDVFRWEFGDQGSVASPAVDRILDFDPRSANEGGDVLNLADLLPEAAASHIGDFVRFESSGEDTMILINSAGNLAGGADQQILLEGVMFAGAGNDQAIINDLISRGSLVVD